MMTKVLQLRSSGSFLGAERVVIELAKRLPALGFEPIIGVPLEKNNELPELCTQAQRLGIAVQPFYGTHPYDLRVIADIRQFVREQSIDIVHAHGYREDLYALGCRKYASIVATNHLWKRTDWKLKLYATVDAYLLRKFHGVFAVSQPILDEMRAAGIAADKTVLIANGIDVDQYTGIGDRAALRGALGIAPDALVLVTVSSLTQEKGLHFAIDALAQARPECSRLHLLIVGGGSEAESLQQQVKARGLMAHVTFAGRRDDIPRVLEASDVFLLPSLMEGLPMAMLEAMASGKAVIASRVGDVPSALTDDCGILIDAGAVDQLAKAILRVAADSALRETLGSRARTKVVQHFSSARMAEHYAHHYRQLLPPQRELSYQ